LFPETTIFFRP